MEIDGKKIGEGGRPYICAEIGNNHNGSVDLCKTLITRAALAGADAVKLQKRFPKTLFTKALYDSPYTGDNSFGPTYGLHREALEFDLNQWQTIVNHARKVGITLFSTVFDHESVDFLEQFDLPAYKIASGELTDIDLVKYVASKGRPMIISTGGCEWTDVDRIYDLMREAGTPFALLHCTMQYPCEPRNMNLRNISSMIARYPGVPIGFSDHSVGTWAIPQAYGLGATVFEKHFTSNRALKGPDHALSIEPDELQGLIHSLDRMREAYGSPDKHYLVEEEKGFLKMAKSIYASRDIADGELLTRDNLTLKSPAQTKGFQPYFIGWMVASRVRANGNYHEGELIDAIKKEAL